MGLAAGGADNSADRNERLSSFLICVVRSCMVLVWWPSAWWHSLLPPWLLMLLLSIPEMSEAHWQHGDTGCSLAAVKAVLSTHDLDRRTTRKNWDCEGKARQQSRVQVELK